MGTRKRRKTFDEFKALLRKEYPSHFVDGLEIAGQRLARFVFEPSFRDYRRVQQLLGKASFRVELRPACRSKSERESLLKDVKRFVQKYDYLAQVYSTSLLPGSSRVVVFLNPLRVGFGDKILQRFGGTAVYIEEMWEGRLQ